MDLALPSLFSHSQAPPLTAYSVVLSLSFLEGQRVLALLLWLVCGQVGPCARTGKNSSSVQVGETDHGTKLGIHRTSKEQGNLNILDFIFTWMYFIPRSKFTLLHLEPI